MATEETAVDPAAAAEVPRDPVQDSAHKSSVSFSVDAKSGADNAKSGRRSMRGSRRSSQRSSFFQRARMSFVRSSGDRGASLETLRGTAGADFEVGDVYVQRKGADAASCGCFGGSSGGAKPEKHATILIKGPFCFIFPSGADEAKTPPKYAISLVHMKAKKVDNDTVTLETSLGDVEYELQFVLQDEAKEFCDVVGRQASAGEAELVRKRLGHEHLLNKRASLRFAENVATKKVEDQPEKPISTEEMLNVAAGATAQGAPPM
eukprot:CAMPEP_0194027112 /NCGR_PEP_ID=MMETSP0009_2-20130614/1336_1 /TAXON_ID=210454 /ORGANISM="Grammatophora oceanica, Strain CCMP 410" /LENGTH=262 /DNA_ID=CAMNT_0038666071 /DNA_START=89 /DNA_END=877 /DNA_ORIENTATION=+